jgi:hypothetical protein
MNATYDDVEGRWKAAQLGNLIADKSKYEAMFHSRVAEKLLAARYVLPKTKQDFQMSIFTEEEIRVFCKRSAQSTNWKKHTGPNFRNEPTRLYGRALSVVY